MEVISDLKRREVRISLDANEMKYLKGSLEDCLVDHSVDVNDAMIEALLDVIADNEIIIDG